MTQDPINDQCVRIRTEIFQIIYVITAIAGELDPPHNHCYQVKWRSKSINRSTHDCLYPTPEDSCEVTITPKGARISMFIKAQTYQERHKNWKIVIEKAEDGTSTSHLRDLCKYGSYQNIKTNPGGSRHICPGHPSFPSREEHGVLNHGQFAEWWANNGLKDLYNEGFLDKYIKSNTIGPSCCLPDLPNGGPIQDMMKKGKCKLE